MALGGHATVPRSKQVLCLRYPHRIALERVLGPDVHVDRMHRGDLREEGGRARWVTWKGCITEVDDEHPFLEVGSVCPLEVVAERPVEVAADVVAVANRVADLV